MQKITPFLWYDTQAEEAVNFYVELFRSKGGSEKDTHIISTSRYTTEMAKAARMPENSAMTVNFKLRGYEFVAINAGPIFKFNESISFVIDCEDQEEVDYFWDNLCANGGQESMCGWLKDKYGLSWQVVPRALSELLGHAASEKSEYAMSAMLKMKKIVVSDLVK